MFYLKARAKINTYSLNVATTLKRCCGLRFSALYLNGTELGWMAFSAVII